MDPIRVVLAELPRMLRDILYASLQDEPDIVLVRDAATPAELQQLVKEGRVDVVMLGLSEVDLLPSHYKLFDVDARVRILAIADHGRNASLYELRPHRTMLGEGSPRELIDVLRRHVQSTNTQAVRASPGE